MTGRFSPRWAIAAVATALLAGCASAPSVPAWRVETRNAVEQATAATLTGHDRVADRQWRLARQAASGAGQAATLARVELARCAVEQTALQWSGCPAVRPYLPDAEPAERAYAAYLGVDGVGGVPPLDALPPAHRAVARHRQEEAPDGPQRTALLSAIPDPLARLVAGGVLWRSGGLEAASVDLLVDTASALGWRRPLAAWLGVRVRLAEAAGDEQSAARARRRLDWVLGARQAEPR